MLSPVHRSNNQNNLMRVPVQGLKLRQKACGGRTWVKTNGTDVFTNKLVGSQKAYGGGTWVKTHSFGTHGFHSRHVRRHVVAEHGLKPLGGDSPKGESDGQKACGGGTWIDTFINKFVNKIRAMSEGMCWRNMD